MSPRDALKVLIQEVDLEPEQRKALIAGLPEMDDAAVMELGSALAAYRTSQARAAQRAVSAIDELLATKGQA
jgi:hypothetical protein